MAVIGWRLVPSTVVVAFLLAAPCVSGSWWYDPHVLANYNLLDAHVQAILTEAEFKPLADFFTAYPAAVRLFGEDEQLRRQLTDWPSDVSQLIETCTHLETLITSVGKYVLKTVGKTNVDALLSSGAYRPLQQGDMVHKLYQPFCRHSYDVSSFLTHCPKVEAWRRGASTPSQYNKSLEAADAVAAAAKANGKSSNIAEANTKATTTTTAEIAANVPTVASSHAQVINLTSSPPSLTTTASPPLMSCQENELMQSVYKLMSTLQLQLAFVVGAATATVLLLVGSTATVFLLVGGRSEPLLSSHRRNPGKCLELLAYFLKLCYGTRSIGVGIIVVLFKLMFDL
jgi:hypothetical protein